MVNHTTTIRDAAVFSVMEFMLDIRHSKTTYLCVHDYQVYCSMSMLSLHNCF